MWMKVYNRESPADEMERFLVSTALQRHPSSILPFSCPVCYQRPTLPSLFPISLSLSPPHFHHGVIRFNNESSLKDIIVHNSPPFTLAPNLCPYPLSPQLRLHRPHPQLLFFDTITSAEGSSRSGSRPQPALPHSLCHRQPQRVSSRSALRCDSRTYRTPCHRPQVHSSSRWKRCSEISVGHIYTQ